MDANLFFMALGALAAASGVAVTLWLGRNTGRRVRVEVTNGFLVFGEPGMPDSRLGEHQIQVSVFNRGDAAVTVISWGIDLPGGSIVPGPSPQWARPPVQVDPGGLPARFFVSADDLRRVHNERGVSYSKVTPWVTLGDGRKISVKGGVPLA